MYPEKPVPADIPRGKLGAICQDLVFPSLQSCGEGKHGKLQKQIFELCSITVFCEIHQPNGGKNIPFKLCATISLRPCLMPMSRKCVTFFKISTLKYQE